VKYACIEKHQHAFEVRLMCRALDVSRSGFYAWKTNGPSQRERQDARLRTLIRVAYRTSKRRYGSPRVHAELKAQGERCSQKRVARLMRQEGLRAGAKRRFRTTTKSDPTHPVAENLLDRQFTVARPNEVWVSDITYVPTREGWLYLAVVIDLFSRSVVGWAMERTLEASLATAALEMALGRRGAVAGLLHHSDRGVQYTCGAYQSLLEANRVRCSMSRKGNCWDNAVAESFFATLEKESIEVSDWHTRAEARRAIFAFIEVWYNRQRRHSSLDYRTPAEYEHSAALPQAA
jgi:putative transposase